FNDGNGNTTIATQKVTVKDVTAPVKPTLADVTGECTATAVAPTTTDSCAGTITGTTTDPLTYNTQGTYTITWTFNDGNGNTTIATQKVTVKDVTAPVKPTLADVTGECTATAVAPTTTDSCAGTITGTTTDPLTYNTQGIYTITWSFNDGNGNTTTATQKITVKDVTAPVMPTLADVTGECTATAVAPTTTDSCARTITGTTTDPLTYNTQGTYTITWTFNDGNGNSTTATQKVIVKDVTAPVINCPESLTVNLDSNSCTIVKANVNLGTPTSNDNCELKSVTNDAPSIFPIGNTTVTWTATDIAGNTATCKQVVTVIDNINPTITCAAPVNITLNTQSISIPKENVDLGTPTSSDNCEVKSITNDAPNLFPIGNTTVTWTVTDNAGNIATCTQLVTVVAPAIKAVNDIAGPINGTNGGDAGINVLTNDTLNGVKVNPTDVLITSTPNGPLTVNTDGTVTVAPNTKAGDYTVDYTICQVLNPNNCSTATVTVTVVAPAIKAVNDIAGTINGTKGDDAGINILTNDTLNGVKVNPTDVLITSTPNGP
ncbi:HYR domain-containing protein, partial [Flavobacterium sp. Arc2]|uniref:HYR domain-containing protein n=1 Tax=Flavobacterium sp. Arc2 TaxID=3046685 RepID=UPI00352CCD8F